MNIPGHIYVALKQMRFGQLPPNLRQRANDALVRLRPPEYLEGEESVAFLVDIASSHNGKTKREKKALSELESVIICAALNAVQN